MSCKSCGSRPRVVQRIITHFTRSPRQTIRMTSLPTGNTVDYLHLVRQGETPPGGMSYHVPETGITIPTGRPPFTCLSDLLNDVRAHYKANRVEAPPDLAARVEDYNCRRLGPDWCRTAQGVEWTKNAAIPSFGLAQLRQASLTIMSWFRDDHPSVPPEQIEKRAETCLACPMHGYPSDCGGCAAAEIAASVGNFIVGSRVPQDEKLKACRVCSCLLRLKVRVPLPSILKHSPSAQLAALPQNCWILREQV